MRRRLLSGRRNNSKAVAIEMASLIDMVFILLIFYIVSTSFIQESGVNINRPDSNASARIDGQFLPIAITKGGSIHVAGRKISPDDQNAISDALGQQSASRVVLQADRDVPTWLLLKVMDTCKDAGAERVDIAAVRK